MKAFILLAQILFFTTNILAQADPVAEVIDDFSVIECDEMLARIDNFDIVLRNNPTKNGVAIVSGSKDHLINKLYLEIRFSSGTGRPGTGSPPIPLIRGDERGEARLKFLMFPRDRPIPKSKTWNLTIPDGVEPFFFHTDADGICSYRTVYKYIGELANANPRLRVNAVFSRESRPQFQKAVSELKSKFSKSTVGRIRFFRQRSDYPFSDTNSVDFWLLP